MNVKDVIRERRAYRSLDHIEITEELVKDLVECAQLAPSCYNNQSWRFVFVSDPKVLTSLHQALSKHNEWVQAASLVVAVFSKTDLDCVIQGREYFLFDTGMATAFMILRATELGLVAHPIAGYDEAQVKTLLTIPQDMQVIALVVVGKHSALLNPMLTESQKQTEKRRPPRLPLDKVAFLNHYSEV